MISSITTQIGSYLGITPPTISSISAHHSICIPDNPYAPDRGHKYLYTAIHTCSSDELTIPTLYDNSLGNEINFQRCLSLAQQQLNIGHLPLKHRYLAQKQPDNIDALIASGFIAKKTPIATLRIDPSLIEPFCLQKFCADSEEASFLRQFIMDIARNDPLTTKTYELIRREEEYFEKTSQLISTALSFLGTLSFFWAGHLILENEEFARKHPNLTSITNVVNALSLWTILILGLRFLAIYKSTKSISS